MNYPELFTVWVIRNNTPCFVGVKNSKAEAIDWASKTVSTREFEVRSYVDRESTLGPEPVVVKAEVIKPELDLSRLASIEVNDD